MNNDRYYYKIIKNVEVWVTVSKPWILDEIKNSSVQSVLFNSAYRFSSEPQIYIGDFVKKNDGRVAWFKTQDEAATAGFLEAGKKLNEN